jgi:hypothetical protein
MEKKKPKWGKPKLIVLTRGKPEERVLDACKSDYSGNNAPLINATNCQASFNCIVDCASAGDS